MIVGQNLKFHWSYRNMVRIGVHGVTVPSVHVPVKDWRRVRRRRGEGAHWRVERVAATRASVVAILTAVVLIATASISVSICCTIVVVVAVVVIVVVVVNARDGGSGSSSCSRGRRSRRFRAKAIAALDQVAVHHHHLEGRVGGKQALISKNRLKKWCWTQTELSKDDRQTEGNTLLELRFQKGAHVQNVDDSGCCCCWWIISKRRIAD